jgi:hypothetical protein
MNRPNNVTMIDELPDLQQLEGGRNYGNNSHPSYGNAYGNPDTPDVSKFIRGNNYYQQRQFPTSGMSPPGQQTGGYPPPGYQENVYPSSDPINEMEGNFSEGNEKKFTGEGSPSCIQVNDHIKSCPICCKFYKNDNTVYIIIIIVLSIMCILLLKRVLDL